MRRLENIPSKIQKQLHIQDTIGNSSSFYIFNFAHVSGIFLLSIAQYNIRVNWAPFVRNSIMTQFGPSQIWTRHAVLTGFVPETTIKTFQSVWVSIWEHCREIWKSLVSRMVISKVRQLGKLTLVVPIRKELPNSFVRPRPWLTTIPQTQWGP